MQGSGEMLRKSSSLGGKYSVTKGTEIVAMSPYLEVFKSCLDKSTADLIEV